MGKKTKTEPNPKNPLRCCSQEAYPEGAAGPSAKPSCSTPGIRAPETPFADYFGHALNVGSGQTVLAFFEPVPRHQFAEAAGAAHAAAAHAAAAHAAAAHAAAAAQRPAQTANAL